MNRVVCLALVLACVGLAMEARAAELEVKPHEHNVKVLIDGALFADYLTDVGTKPIVWPIIGPTGAPITRAYPMEVLETEKQDHPHQRSFWFTHGDVNGIDFWSEPISFTGKKKEGKRLGTIVHREFRQVEASGGVATIRTVNDWLDENGKKQCEDERTLTFRADGQTRTIDFDVTVSATAGNVEFRNTKEGSLGIRIPTSMDVDQKDKKPGGRIITSEGLTDKDAWGKPAAWVDYHGPVAGETVGIAILNHPSSLRAPTHWHVRTYGLFAANPFGLGDFDPKSGADGNYTLESGKSFSLRYRIIFHRGDEKESDIAGAYARYASEKKGS